MINCGQSQESFLSILNLVDQNEELGQCDKLFWLKSPKKKLLITKIIPFTIDEDIEVNSF